MASERESFIVVSPALACSGEDKGEKRQSYTQIIAGKLKPNDSILVKVIKEQDAAKMRRFLFQRTETHCMDQFSPPLQCHKLLAMPRLT